MIHFCVVEAIQEMNAAWTGSCDTHTQSAGELRIGASHEGSCLFMPHMNEPYPILLCPERFEDSVDPVARETEYGVNAPREKTLYKYI
jgi:hypothetical protein